MQAVSKGLEKVEQELTASDTDGAISVSFQEVSSVTKHDFFFVLKICPFELGGWCFTCTKRDRRFRYVSRKEELYKMMHGKEFLSKFSLSLERPLK